MVQVQAPNTWQPLKFKEEFQKTQLWSRKSQRDAFLTKQARKLQDAQAENPKLCPLNHLITDEGKV